MKRINRPALLLFLTFLLLPNAQQLFSQQVSRPDRGIGAVAPYQSSNIENINLQNGNVGLSIPLASLPPIAGGKLEFTIKAHYNSKLWDTYMEQRFTEPGEGATWFWVQKPRVSDFGGWRIGGAYSLYQELAQNDYVRHQGYYDTDTPILQSYQWHKTFFITPDGSKHEIRPFAQSFWGSNTPFYGGYYKDSPYTTGNAMRYYSVDGSYIWLTVYPPGSALAWEANLPDGTKIQQSNDYVQRIIDSNGNKIKIFSDEQGTHYQDEQTGREIRVFHNINTQRTEVWYQTVGGGWQKVEIVWGSTFVTGKFYSVERPSGPYNPGCTYHEIFSADLSVIREIIFPQTESGQSPPKYSFSYNSDVTDPNGATYVTGCNTYPPTETYPNPSKGLGEVSQMTTPSGAVYKYSYFMDEQHITSDGLTDWNAAANTVAKKTVTHDSVTDTWNYSISASGIGSLITNPDGSSQSLEAYAHASSQPSTNGGTTGLSGLVYRETQSNKIRTERRWARLVFNGANDTTGGGKIAFNPVIAAEYTSLLDDNGNPVVMSAKTFQHDYNGNVKETREYDWFDPNLVSRDAAGVPLAVPGSAVLLRVTTNSYHNSPATANALEVYAKTSNSILNAVKEVSVGDGITRYSYDNQAYGAAPLKGNVTQVSVWDNTANQWINSSSTYDSYGNETSKTNPKGAVTQIFYEDNTHAMPTKTIVDPQNGTGAQITASTYDFYTGLELSSTDASGNVSTSDYTNHLLGTVDPYGRVGTTYSPYISVDGVNKRRTVKFYYEDSALRTRTETDLFNEGDGLLKTRETRDQLGRTILTEKNENGANAYAISIQTIYKTQDRVVLTSNPRRGTPADTDGWTRVTTDVLGRTVETATFSGAAQPPVTGGTTGSNFTGKVTTEYAANTTTVTDEAGKRRRSVANAVGQVVRVDEPNAAGQLDVNGAPAQPTSYEYDAQGNLTKVIQGVQVREFFYDSLSRLKEARNPESGTVLYAYDLNGNLQTKRDARGIRTIYEYDALDRVIRRCYTIPNPQGNPTSCGALTPQDTNPNTPPVTYVYDNLPNAKGKLTKIITGDASNPFAITDYQAFDALGRVTQSQQSVDGTAYNPMTYVYNLSGELVEQTYPSGRVVRNVFDNGGELAAVKSRKNQNAGFWNYARHFTYSPTGAISSMQLGNGRWESTQFNSRLQPVQIALGSTETATDKLKLIFDYGTTQNNGNVISQTIVVPTEVRGNQTYGGFTATQTYTYDSLNRLKSAEETIPGRAGWKQTFQYDRYGNRNFDQTNTTMPDFGGGALPKVFNPEVLTSNNRFKADQDGDNIDDYLYDAAGNTTKDAQGKTFVYDAENKQTEVKNAAGATIGQYFYDGEGKRVKKVAGGEVTIFIYDATGKLVAEYANQISQTPKVSYLTQDRLGSPRINTDANGNVTARHDYHPFGEEIQRAGYGTDDLRKKFATYERDDESELDFAQARYYSPKHGRFYSVDPENFGATTDDPQSWNAYAYARNNPLLFSDPRGLDVQYCDTNQNCVTLTSQEENTLFNKKYQASIGNTVKNGKVINSQGEVIATYVNNSPAMQMLRGAEPTLKIWQPVVEFVQPMPVPAGMFAKAGMYGLRLLKGTKRAAQVAKIACCFVAGTPVLTKDGLKPIEEIRVGDEVLSFNEKTQQLEYKAVVQTFERYEKDILRISVEGEAERLGVTPEHPFYVRVHRARGDLSGEADEEGEWKVAGQLQIGDEIRLTSGDWAKVVNVGKQKKGAKTYNFEVADNHNYFVGDTGLLVHNQCRIISRIAGHPTLVKAAEAAGASVQRGIDNLTKELAKGNLNPGIGTSHLKGDIYYARSRDGARVFFRQVGNTIEILAKASKHNEQQVINILNSLY
jgi:RHS repeat-associated protein